MAEQIDYVVRVSDEQFIASMNKWVAAIEQSQTQLDDLGGAADKTFQSAAESATDAEKAAADFAKTTSKATEEQKKQAEQQTRSNKLLRDSIGQFRIFGTTINEWRDRIGNARKTLIGYNADLIAKRKAQLEAARASDQNAKAQGGLAKGLLLGARAAKILRAALIATGIGAIVVLIGVLISALASLFSVVGKGTNELGFFEKLLIGIKTTINVLIDRGKLLIGVLEDIFTGDFRGAIEGTRQAFSGLGAEIRKETQLMFEMAIEVKKLDAEYRNLSLATASARSEIEKNRDIANDETRSFRERQAAIKAAAADQETLDQKRLELAGRNLALAEKERVIRGETPEILDKIAEASVNLLDIEADIQARRRQDAQAQRAILTEQKDRIDELRKAYRQFLDELENRSESARIELLDGSARAIAERERALKDVQKFRDEIVNAAKSAGQELPATFEAQFKDLAGQIEEEYKKAIDEIQTKDAEKLLTQKLRLDGKVLKNVITDEDRKQLTQSIETGAEKAIREAEEGTLKELKLRIGLVPTPELTGFEALKAQILEALRITEEEAGLIFEAVGDLAGSVVKGFDDISEAQLEKTKAVTDAIEDQIDTVRGFLEDEQKLREQGFANDAAKYEAQLANLNQLKEKSEQEAVEKERKLARQRLAINAAEQISEYALAAIRLIASEAKRGVVGLVLGIGGLALIARLVTQSRAAAIRSAEVPKFREGTPYVTGPGTKTSDSIPALLSRGERVMDAASNDQIGGAKIPNTEIVRLFKIGQLADNIPQTGVISLAPILKELAKDRKRVIELKESVNIEAMREAYDRAAQGAANQIISYMKTRPVRKFSPGGEIVEWWEGGSLNRQIKKNEK